MAPEDREALPLGSACAAAGLVASGLFKKEDIEILSPVTEESSQNLYRRIVDAQPSLVGFSLYCWNSLYCIDVAARLRENLPKLLLVAGGPDAERLAHLEDPEPFNAVFLGEAEESLPAWWAQHSQKGTRLDQGQGCSFNQYFIRAAGAPKTDLPSPWLLGLIAPASGKAIPWELTRGCPYRCAYCYEGRGSRQVRHLPQSRLEKELALFARAGVSEAFVLDPTFNLDSARTLRYLSFLSQKGHGMAWNFEIRAELVNKAQAEAFSSLPCFVQVGLQSSDARVLELNGRSFDPGKFKAGLRLLNEAGVVFGLDLIYGLPGDSLAGFKKSVDYALSFSPNHLDIFPLAVLPGTDMEVRNKELGLRYDELPPYLLHSHPSFSSQDMDSAATLASKVNFFYTRGRAVPWFASVCAALKLSPSAFLDSFSPPDNEKAMGQREIEGYQCSHARRSCELAGKEGLIPAVLDLIRFNGAWSRALAEQEKSRVKLAYSLKDLMGLEILKLADFVARKKQKPCSVEILPGKSGPTARLLKS